jgi:hypothetical protein
MKLLNMASKLMKSHRTVVILGLLVLIAIIYYFVIRKNEGFREKFKVNLNDLNNVDNLARKEEYRVKAMETGMALHMVAMELGKNKDISDIGDMLTEEYKITLEPILKKLNITLKDLVEGVQAMIQLNTNNNYTDHEAHMRLHEDIAKQSMKNKLIANTARNLIYTPLRRLSGNKLAREENAMLSEGIFLKINKNFDHKSYPEHRYIIDVKNRKFNRLIRTEFIRDQKRYESMNKSVDDKLRSTGILRQSDQNKRLVRNIITGYISAMNDKNRKERGL